MKIKLFFSFLGLFFATTIAKADILIPPNTGLPDPGGSDPIILILIELVAWLLTVFLILAVLAFVITGLMYLFSMGDGRSQTLENAKQYFKYSIIAVITVGSSYILINSIDLFLNGIL
jgi:hypothetical protein